MQARRSTPMYLVEDLDDARLRYIGLGFVPIPTDDDGCCGVQAGQTHIILINRDHAERTLPPRAVALLESRPALYVWVESLEDLRVAAWAESDTFLGEVSTAGLREWAVESEHGLLVFAETTQRQH
jgi:hypothetical protein